MEELLILASIMAVIIVYKILKYKIDELYKK